LQLTLNNLGSNNTKNNLSQFRGLFALSTFSVSLFVEEQPQQIRFFVKSGEMHYYFISCLLNEMINNAIKVLKLAELESIFIYRKAE